MNQREIIVHTGLSKTGTTFLQKNVFPNLNLYFEGASYMKTAQEELLRNLILLSSYIPNPLHYDKSLQCEFKNDLWNYINEKNINNFEKFLFSFESFSGCSLYEYKNQDENIELIKYLFGTPKIFFVFRKQTDWIESQYNQLFKNGNEFTWGGLYLQYMNLNEILGYKSGKFDKNNKYINICTLNWLNLYYKYINNFGKENVLALPYELFKENPQKFLKTFYEFFNIEPFYPNNFEYINTRVKSTELQPLSLIAAYKNITGKAPLKIRRIIEKNEKGLVKILMKSQIKIPQKRNLNKQKLSPNQKKIIMDIHKENNINLAKEIGIELSHYGYY